MRDFRGAMVGRGDKGLIITTGEFTPAARAEATRDGAPPIDLIGGDDLCDLLLEHRVGVEVTERMVREVTVVQTFLPISEIVYNRSSSREVKILMRLPDGRNVATHKAVHGSAPCARTEVTVRWLGTAADSPCLDDSSRGDGRRRRPVPKLGPFERPWL